MKKILDYLLMRNPPARLGTMDTGGAAGKVPTGRVVASFVGILAGIIVSFFVTGLKPGGMGPPGGPPPATTNLTNNLDQNGVGIVAGTKVSATPPSSPGSAQLLNFTWKRFAIVCVIALVICCLTYQQLYFSLRLYASEPGFLILFVSFQYGYFWQSLVVGGGSLLNL
jgi:hypothetical protein